MKIFRSKNEALTLLKALELVNRTSAFPSKALVLDELANRVDLAFFFFNLEGTCLFLNQNACQLFALNKQDMLGKSYWEFFEDHHFGFSMIEALQLGLTFPKIFPHLPGKEYLVSTKLFVEGPKEGHGLLLYVENLTEKTALKRQLQLRSTQEELGRSLREVTHEIRNPLGGIRGMASLLVKDLKETPHLQEMAEIILEGTRHLETLISSVLYYSKDLSIQKVSVEMGAFLRKVLRLFKADPAFPDTVELIYHIPYQALLAPIDQESLQRAILNLLINALQAMPFGGRLTVCCLETDGSVQISVSDTGIGMDEQIQEKLFFPSFTTKTQGNGLGLVEVKKVIDAHQGSIQVHSYPNKGSSFTLTLPL